MARGRKIETLDLDDGKTQVTIEQLPYEDAEDLLPEVAQIISAVTERFGAALLSGQVKAEDDILKLLPMLGGLANQLGDGKLRRLVPRLLKTTVVITTDDTGDKVKHELVKKEDRAALFEDRPDLYFVLLWHAGRVTFGRFFPANARQSKKPGMKKPASS